MTVHDWHHLKALYQGKRKELVKAALWPFLLATSALFSGCEVKTSPPDVSSCTRIEVSCIFPPSAFGYFFVTYPAPGLSSEESTYIESFRTFVISDPNRIKRLSDALKQGLWRGREPWGWSGAHSARVRCYRNGTRVASFTIRGSTTVVASDRGMFSYPYGVLNIALIEPVELHQFKLRGQCANNMRRISISNLFYRQRVHQYPDPNRWCDVVVRVWEQESYERIDLQGSRPEEWVPEAFLCPSLREHAESAFSLDAKEPNTPARPFQSSYAMNQYCEPNSPKDTVLLFEAKPGWNQHGGPELFNFDNHDPKGGCVMLNDGTVKFTRTKEELAQLRWKP